MAKKRKQKTGPIRAMFTRLVTLAATVFTGAGVSGYAYPELPVVGSAVHQTIGAVKAQFASTADGQPGAGLADMLPDSARQAAQQVVQDARSQMTQHNSPTGAAGGAVAGQMVSAQSRRPATAVETISIASYNIQVFGESKLAKTDVMGYLVQAVRMFDIVAIQEVRSKNDQIIPEFVKMINADGSRYNYVVGPRLGRSNSKEQYAFIFNSDRLEVDARSVLTIDDPADNLHREPLIARFRVRTPDPSQGFTFWLVNTHTDPDEVPEEVDALSHVFTSVQQQGWGEDDVIMLGDLNASENQLGRLGSLPGIRHAIGGVPTNTRGSKTYDNILFDGRTTVEYSGRSGVGNVMQHFGLSEDKALEISDHFPVWAQFSAFEGGGNPATNASQPTAAYGNRNAQPR